jgi:hypothetical protein
MTTSNAENESKKRALRAVSEVVRHLGVSQVDPVLLHHSQHISILLPSMATVARIWFAKDAPSHRDG